MRFSFVVLFSLMSFQAVAGDAASVGVGGVSCTEWIARGSVMVTKLEQENWVLDYVRGVNASSPRNFLQGADGPAMLLFVDTFCAKNENKKLIDAADDLIATLKAQTR